MQLDKSIDELLSEPNKDPLQSKLLYLLLLRSGTYSYLPDLFDALDEDVELMTRLLTMFAGSTIKFPSMDLLEQFGKEIRIYLRIIYTNKAHRAKVMRELASEYFLHEEAVRVIYHKIKKVVDAAGVRLRYKDGRR